METSSNGTYFVNTILNLSVTEDTGNLVVISLKRKR